MQIVVYCFLLLILLQIFVVMTMNEHMGQILQDRENIWFMSYFQQKLSLALVWPKLMGESLFFNCCLLIVSFFVVCVKLENTKI